MPDYISPFTAYRAWQWDSDGLKSMNHAKWTPKVAFEATCERTGGISPAPWLSKADRDECQKELQERHQVPDENCTCGMYAGIDFQHLINIGYASQGIHGEVLLWGKLERCELGWRAQYAYPKFFVIPPDYLPFQMIEIERRVQQLIAYDVDIYLQMDNVPVVGGMRLPLWMKGYGWSQQGIGHLMETRKEWYTRPTVPPPSLKAGDRISVRDKGIGIVTHVDDDVHYTLFTTYNYRLSMNEFVWSRQNWRWETDSTGTLVGQQAVTVVVNKNVERFTVGGDWKPGDKIVLNGKEVTITSVTHQP